VATVLPGREECLRYKPQRSTWRWCQLSAWTVTTVTTATDRHSSEYEALRNIVSQLSCSSVTGLWTVRLGHRFLSSVQCSDRFWGPPSLPIPVVFKHGVRVTPGERKDILYQSKRNRETAWTLNQLWSSHTLTFVPELKCWHARNKLNHLVNRLEPH
jgi:hypothetical protein